ncbi:MAG: hypothetical protein QM617_03425, partial [Comamonas sp.]
LAIAARLHVLLRRETGRIVDTDWLAENEEYAGEILRLAREHAQRSGHQGLRQCADELAYALAHAAPAEPRTLFERVAWSIRHQGQGARGG